MTSIDLFARSTGLISKNIADSHVLIVGCGSVGSYMAEMLARAGVSRFTLIDPDIIESHNVARSLFYSTDVSRPKCEALAQRIAEIAPKAEIKHLKKSFLELDYEDQKKVVSDATVAVAATDDNAVQLRVVQVSYWANVPTISPGIYKSGQGGEVIMSVPGYACWNCATVGVRDEVVQPSADYGTGRLMAVPGLLTDIHFVSSCATKLALGLIETDTGVAVHDLISAALENNKVYVLFGMAADYWIFPQMLGGAAGQLAFQSIWVEVQPRETCTICGDPENRINPYSVSRTPLPNHLDELRHQIRD